MSRNYKFHNPDGVYFVSFAVVEWIAVFKATRGDSCGSGGKRTISYIYRAEPEEIDSTEAYSLSRTGVDRVMAMPAFVLQGLCLRELKKDIAEFVNTAVTLTSAISSFGSLVFLTRSIGIGSRLWVAQQRLTQLIALKNTISVFLLSKDCEEWIKKGGWVGVNFVEAFKNIDTILNLGGESALKAILKMDFVDQVIVLVAGWEAIKLRPDVGRYFDEKNLTKMDSYVKELVNLRKQINGEVGGEVE